jgi:hypothetical protein
MPSNNDERKITQDPLPCNESLSERLLKVLETKMQGVNSPAQIFYALQEFAVALAVSAVDTLNAMEIVMGDKDPNYVRGAFFAAYVPCFMEMSGAKCITATPELTELFENTPHPCSSGKSSLH